MNKCIFTITTSFALSLNALAEIHYVGADALDFIPDVIYVNAGDTVHWDYLGGMAHTVTTGTDCLWDGYFHESLASFNPVVEWVIDQWSLSNSKADISGDGMVDVTDLLVVVGN